MQLIDDWRRSWRWASVRLAVVAGAISGWAASDPYGFARALDVLPEWMRPLVGLAVAITAIGTRITTKGNSSDAS